MCGNWNEHKDVLAHIAEATDWTTLTVAQAAPLMERAGVLENVFFTCAHARDDKASARLFQWIMQAITDAEIVPLLEATNRRGIFNVPRNLGDGLGKARDHAASVRAEQATALYHLLPTFEVRPVSWLVTENEYAHGKEKFPTLLETCRAMLTEVSSRCFTTADKAESDTLFAFLLALAPDFSKEREVRLETIRKATDDSVEPERLERHFVQAVEARMEGQEPEIVDRQEIANILAIAWVRNTVGRSWDISGVPHPRRQGIQKIAACMRTMRPLEYASDTTLAFLESNAEKIGAVEGKMQNLIGVIRPLVEYRYGYRRGTAIDVTHEFRGDVNHAMVTITYACEGTPHESEKNMMHDGFALAKKKTDEWVSAERTSGTGERLSVHLKLIAYNKWASKEEKGNGRDILLVREAVLK